MRRALLVTVLLPVILTTLHLPEAECLRLKGGISLPLIEVKAKGEDRAPRPGLMAVMLTGDGGWAELDRKISGVLANRGIPVIGFDTLRYFWTPRTPEEAAGDLAAVLTHYLEVWKKEKVILIGYSLGADALPFMVNRLPKRLADRIDLVVLLGPGRRAEFEFHLVNWLGFYMGKTRPTLPEVLGMKAEEIVCVFGKEETESLCRSLPASVAKIVSFPGGHHFGGKYREVADKILSYVSLEPAVQ
jgi:type IV secretory pathway VirJ component